MDNLNIYGIGTDIIEVQRIKNAILKFSGFRERIYTAREISYCENKKNPSAKYISYAQRFAAKEAVAKALGTGLGKHVFFSEIEVINRDSGKPEINLYGKSKNFCMANFISEILISLTGTKDYGAAFAIAVRT
ncbi:MAG: holo-[acyl-carrier-protein] synthase [Actinobacteria bacterium]|nr:holo-[acyl-carrier-protein] synthase [Actinomycetota bacterium]